MRVRASKPSRTMVSRLSDSDTSTVSPIKHLKSCDYCALNTEVYDVARWLSETLESWSLSTLEK